MSTDLLAIDMFWEPIPEFKEGDKVAFGDIVGTLHKNEAGFLEWTKDK